MSSIKVIEGGIICFSVLVVVMLLVVNVGLYLCLIMVGSVSSFMVIMVVLMMLVLVVSNMFIRVIDIFRLLGKWLNSWVMVFNRFLVILDFFRVMFINMNSGIVSRVLLFMMLKIWFGKLFRMLGLNRLSSVLLFVKVSVILVRVKVIG